MRAILCHRCALSQLSSGSIRLPLVEMKRGLGMFVKPGARDQLLKGERQKFLTDEWPRIAEKIQRLGLTQRELDAAAARRSSSRKR